MKKHWPWLLTALIALKIVGSLVPKKDKEGEFKLHDFGRLPVLLGGRLQPIDSVARNNLLIIRGTTKVPLEGNGAGGKWGKWEDLEGGLSERKWYQFSKRPKKLYATEWLLELFSKPSAADNRYVFRIHHPELLGELELTETGVDRSGLRYYTYNQLRPHMQRVETEARVISQEKAERRTPYQKSVMTLVRAVQLYERLRESARPSMVIDDEVKQFFHPDPDKSEELGIGPGPLFSFKEIEPVADDIVAEHERLRAEFGQLLGRLEMSSNHPQETYDRFTTVSNRFLVVRPIGDKIRTYQDVKKIWQNDWNGDFAKEIEDFATLLPTAMQALNRQQTGQEFDTNAAGRVMAFASRYLAQANQAHPLIIPPADFATDSDNWSNIGKSLMDSIRAQGVSAPIRSYAKIVSAYANGDIAAFNSAVVDYTGLLNSKMPNSVEKGRSEYIFNKFLPFKNAMYAYIIALLFALVFWLRMTETWRKASLQLITLGVVVHTAGLIYRMVISGYAPVTNLYSSAIFVGWAAVLLGILLEWVFKNGVGIVTSASVGYTTLIIAHHLAMEGDTMEMMRAVLDTNFWLATHVTIITIGYAATFLAGFLAIIYLLRGIFTPSLDDDTAKSLVRMVYGIVCFATLFSFVGTVLGGLWADYSWGRFWGWDPKENGALLIVIWNATILHLRWGGMIRDRGLMNCAIFGNVVTAFSWFGVNMLGIGLHSYGFMDAAFKWLAIFSLSQFALIAIGGLPFGSWLSVKRGKLKPAGFKA